MSGGKKTLCAAMAAVLLICACLPAKAQEKAPLLALVERIAVLLAAFGQKDERKRDMEPGDTSAASLYELPEGLPGDDSLCLAVLGFRLNPDGTMREELTRRLEIARRCAEKYPNALIVCTGGSTAASDPAATEAGRMAEWLAERGVDRSRIVAEDRALTTAQNAAYTLDILQARYPRVRRIVLVSSDYHIAAAKLLFGMEAISRGSPIQVVGSAACRAPDGLLSAVYRAGEMIGLPGKAGTALETFFKSFAVQIREKGVR